MVAIVKKRESRSSVAHIIGIRHIVLYLGILANLARFLANFLRDALTYSLLSQIPDDKSLTNFKQAPTES